MINKEGRADYYHQWYLKNKESHAAKAKQRKIDSGWKPKVYKLVDKKICRRCKKIDLPLLISCRSKYRIYYFCRECNLFYSRKYRSTEKGRARIRVAVYRSIAKHPERQEARMAVAKAIYRGEIIRPDKCSQCQSLGKIEAHHPNYSQPLNVIWLCKPCHTRV